MRGAIWVVVDAQKGRVVGLWPWRRRARALRRHGAPPWPITGGGETGAIVGFAVDDHD
jgi:hypothetical protein